MGCVKLHILDQQYKYTELKVSCVNKKLTLNNSAVKERREILVRYIDPTGMEIEEVSLKEWTKLKQQIEKQRDKIQSDINILSAKAESEGWSSEKLVGKIGNKTERLACLNSSIGTMKTPEGSTQVYSLSHTGYGENGGVTLNTSTNVIDIKFGSTPNFIHEMTHAGQFETRDALIQAYPWNAVKFRGLPANYNIRTLQGIYYKR